MNARERFLACMNFDRSVRPLLWEFGYWGGTLNRWYAEGLPRPYGLSKQVQYGEGVCGEGLDLPLEDLARDRDVHSLLGFDQGEVAIPVNLWMCPAFEEEILEEEGETRIVIDDKGIKKRERLDEASMPQFLEWPVKDKESWEKLKAERFQMRLKDRLPANWEDLKEEYRHRDYPLSLGGGTGPVGFFGSLRFLLGELNLLLAYYDQPQLIKQISSFLTDFWISLFAQVLAEVEVDCARIWEDMAFKTGPLISPHLVREFMLPCYKKLTDFLKSQGVRIILLDSDGDCRPLIPLWLEAGITGLYPNEVQAGMDIVEIRKTYPHLQLLGGLDKKKMASGKQEIERELSSKVPFMLKQGGYIPYADHLIPPDVSWENFRYYRERLCELIMSTGNVR